jgi:hypothetical protein
MPAKLAEVIIGFDIPVLGLSAKSRWTPDPSVENAVWAVYVEMATRIAVAALNTGHLREALSSYHDLFVELRKILREGGPALANTPGDESSFAALVLWMLNGEIRPVLSEWHVRLNDYEAQRPETVSTAAHEAVWRDAEPCVAALNDLSKRLFLYAKLFERVCGITRSPIPDTAGHPDAGSARS